MGGSISDQTAPCDIFVLAPDGTLPPAPANMADIWPKIRELLLQARRLMNDEAAVQSQQHGLIRDGCFLMPSPYPGLPDDMCVRSWFHEYQFYYELGSGPEPRYLWITGQLDRGYAMDTIWFPSRNVAVTAFAPSMEAGRLARFREMLANSIPKPVWAAPPHAIPRIAVVGFQHLMHMMWNELPALDRLVGTSLPDAFKIAVQCEPFGPTTALFPELASVIRPVRYDQLPVENSRHGLVLGLGSWTITPATQDRVRRVAAEQTDGAVLERRDRFKASHHPVFWLSVKPPKRTMSDQAETLAALIVALRADYPDSGFILDGASLPWDLAGNSNYPSWFHEVSDRAVTGSAAIIADVLARIASGLHAHVITLNDISACEEVVWGEAASFYICHGGTMQNKIGWIHRVPGYIHSNRTFLRFARMMPPPVPNGPPCFYAPDALIVDDDPANYSALELARKDQNYRFTSVAALIAEVRQAVGG
jgi:hypothetical protein